MKKLTILLMTFIFISASCNNNKNDKNQNINNREKDDYGKMNDPNKDNMNSGNSNWTSSDESRFLKECMASFEAGQENLANKICPCVLEKVSSKFSSYTEADAIGNTSTIEKMTKDCVAELNIDNNSNINLDDHNNTGGSWSAKDVSDYVDNCVESAVQEGMSRSRAKRYCSCMQQKFEQNYPDPKELIEMNEDQIMNLSGKFAAQCLSDE